MIKWLLEIAVKKVLTANNVKNAISTGVNALLAKADKKVLMKYGKGLSEAAQLCANVSSRIADGTFTDAERDDTIAEVSNLVDFNIGDELVDNFINRLFEKK